MGSAWELELGTFPVHEVRWGSQNRWHNGVLELDRTELLDAVRQDSRIVKADLELASASMPARITNVRDIIEPRVKVQGPGMVYPGVCGRPVITVGQGRTHRLAGVGVVESAPVPFYLGNDGWIPGPLDVLPAVQSSAAEPVEDPPSRPGWYIALALEVDPALSIWDQNDAAHAAALLVCDRLAATTIDLEPPVRERFALPPVSPELPRVVYIMCLRSPEHYAASTNAWWTAVYGVTRLTSPWPLHPTELLDGAISVRQSWTHVNNPLVLDLLRGHGGDFAFAGVIVIRTRWSAQAEKDLTALQAAKVAHLLGAQGAIITWDSGGNDFMEVIRTVQACEQAGIKTVFLTGEEPPETGGPPLLEPLPEADAIVSTGYPGRLAGDPPPPPAPERIIGGEDESYDPNAGLPRRQVEAAGQRPRFRYGGDRYGFTRVSAFEY
jgi:sarcosine reductase